MVSALELALKEVRDKLINTEPYTVEVSREVDAITTVLEDMD